MLQVMGNAMLAAAGWLNRARSSRDDVEDRGYSPNEDRAERLRRMRAAIDAATGGAAKDPCGA